MTYRVILEETSTGREFELTGHCPESFIPNTGDLLEFCQWEGGARDYVWYRGRVSDRATKIDTKHECITVTLMTLDLKVLEEEPK